MKQFNGSSRRLKNNGFTLLELLIATGWSAAVLLGLVQVISAVSSMTRLQDNQAQLLDRSRHAIELLSSTVRQAGFNPRPWDEDYRLGDSLNGSADGVNRQGDRLVVRSWSDRNCFDNRNPVVDSDGNPRYFLRQTAFDVTGSGQLGLQCHYGPSEGSLTRQINRQGVIEGTESFQLLFAEHTDTDGMVDRWVNAGHRMGETGPAGIRVGLLLAADDPVTEAADTDFQVLDSPALSPDDGRLHRVFEFDVAIRGTSG